MFPTSKGNVELPTPNNTQSNTSMQAYSYQTRSLTNHSPLINAIHYKINDLQRKYSTSKLSNDF